jgi:hypothetical protein
MKKLSINLRNISQLKKIGVFLGLMIFEFWFVLSLTYKRYWGIILLIGTIIALFFIYWQVKKEENKKQKGTLLAQLILNIKGEAGSWIGILTVIFVVINLNIISDLIWETKDSVTITNLKLTIPTIDQIDWWMLNKLGILITQMLLITCFLITPVLLFPITAHQPNNKPRVLICGISLLVDMAKDVKSKELVKKKLFSVNSDSNLTEDYLQKDPKISSPKKFEIFNFKESEGCWGKWNVIRHSLESHKSICKVVLVASKEIHELNQTIDQIINEENSEYYRNFKIENLISAFYPSRRVEVYYSNPMDFNDFYDVKSKLQSLISEQVLGKGFDDSDLLFNITGGTAQVTAAMILSSLKGDRKAEYIHQNTGEVVSVDVDILTIQDLWDEIGLRVLKNKV